MGILEEPEGKKRTRRSRGAILNTTIEGSSTRGPACQISKDPGWPWFFFFSFTWPTWRWMISQKVLDA